MMNIMRKFTLKSMRMNKSRTVVTVIGIALSMAMITIIACSAASLQESYYNFYLKVFGNYDVCFFMEKPTSDNIEKLELNRNTETIYKEEAIGNSPFKDSTSKFRKFISIISYSENCFKECYDFSLKEGHYPQNPDEIVLSKDFMDYSSKKYKTGDKMTLDVGVYQSKDGIAEIGADSVFNKSFTKTYTVVGILEREPQNDDRPGKNYVNIYGYTDLSDNIATAFGEGEFNKAVKIKIHNGNRDNCVNFISDITGIDSEDIFESLYGMNFGEETENDTYKKLAESEFRILSVSINDNLHSCNESFENTFKPIMFYISLGLIILVMAASVFIIKNAFSISLTEKIVLYGNLSTVGATPKQIRNSIFFEGFVLGIFGISIGLFIGIGGGIAVVNLSNVILFDVFEGLNITFSISWISVLAAIVLGAATIFFASVSAAMRASRVSPIEAVRRNKEIYIKKGKKNTFKTPTKRASRVSPIEEVRKNKEIYIKRGKKNAFKTPAFISKVFGVGGKLAWKNMKRSKRQYRTALISIVVSVSLFIAAFSFVNYSLYLYNTTLISYNCNMSLELPNDTYNGEERLSFDEQEDIFKEIAKYDEVEDYCYTFYDPSCYLIYDIPNDKLPEKISDYDYTVALHPNQKYKYSKNMGFDIISDKNGEWNNMSAPAHLIAFDDLNYKKLLKKLGYSYDKMKDKAIIVNINQGLIKPDNESDESITHTIKYMKNPVGYTLDMKYHLCDKENGTYLPEEQHLKLEIGGEITNTAEFKDLITKNGLNYGYLIVSKEWLLANYPEPDKISNMMYIFSSNSVRTEQRLSSIDREIYIYNNIVESAKQVNSIASIVQYLVYGIIAVISLIAVTNIFNTVTTNMKFRQKEFAMLRSVGMTKREFNGMITLECLFYAVKGLFIGCMTGIIATAVIHYIFTSMWDAESVGKSLEFMFPWQAVLISISAVIVLILITAGFSKKKLKKQNIIEIIRNDNI